MRTPTVTRTARNLTDTVGGQSPQIQYYENAPTPTDKLNLVKITMFALGIGTMLAESMLLTIGTYYKQEYPDYPFLVYLVLPAYALPNLIFLLIMTGIHDI